MIGTREDVARCMDESNEEHLGHPELGVREWLEAYLTGEGFDGDHLANHFVYETERTFVHTCAAQGLPVSGAGLVAVGLEIGIRLGKRRWAS